jgi:CotH kinase protein
MKRLIIFLFLGAMMSCQKAEEKEVSPVEEDFVSVPEVLTCGAEEVITKENGLFLLSSADGCEVNGGETQSSENSRTGDFSVKLDSINKYGFGLKIKDPKPGEFIRFTVWQKRGTGHGTLYTSSYGTSGVMKNRTHYNMLRRIEDGWVMHTLSIVVAPGTKEVEAVVFSGGRLAYFDDFKVERFNKLPANKLENQLQIHLPTKSHQKISALIKDAKKGQVIRPEHKKYVKAFLYDGENRSKIKLKLKGDWTDHLSSGKISCRIKMKSDAYNGMKTFSLQHPKTRNYVDEWIVHKMADQEDVLTTTFDFVNLNINGVNHGVYALEEHFDKQLLESRNRREGPILKLDETGLWELTYAQMELGYLGEFPFFEASQIKCFKDGRTLSNPKLKSDFEEGARLLELFKNGYDHPEELFDLNELAKFQVLCDISTGVHASAWHNRRFYFNPVTQKLEVILYDLMAFGYGENPPFIYQSTFSHSGHPLEESLDYALMRNEEYRELYFKNFERISSQPYLAEFFAQHQVEIDGFENAIQLEEPSYVVAQERFFENAKFLRSNVTAFEKLWVSSIPVLNDTSGWILDDDYSPRADKVFFEGISLNSYLEDSTSLGFNVRLENYHLNSIEICGYASDHWPGHVFEIEEKIKLDGFKSENNTAEYLALYKPTKIFFKVSNRERRYYESEVLPWSKPNGLTTRMELKRETLWQKHCVLNGNKAKISGDVEISNLLYLPEGIDLEITPGSKIDFVEKGGLIVNGNFRAVSSAQNPIILNGVSETNNGITILNAESVQLKNVIANDLSNLNHESWILTGAISIYESNVAIENLQIFNAQCEDALNIIRSDFNVSELLIEGCMSDGFDADFCSGYLRSSVFKNTGNDCIDFSGSRVTIDEVYIKNSGDKGVSGGEASTLSLNNITIDGAITGIASKDKSHLYGENVSIKNTEYSLMVFQKKPEYGPASLQLEKSQIKDGLEVIDLKSILTVNGLVKEGVEKIDVDALYQRFE